MIYFIQTSDNQYMKIGKANDPYKRLASLQTGMPQKLKLLATMPGDHDEEHAIHHRFTHLRVRGEWFRSTPELVTFAFDGHAALTNVSNDDRSELFQLALHEPRVLSLVCDAASVADDDLSVWFCANDVFYGHHRERSFKRDVNALVGWHATMAHPALQTMQAYDAVYKAVYNALPDCRGCACL